MKLYSPNISGSLTISGSITLYGNMNVYGTASYTVVSASSLNVGTNIISVNVAEPAQRFGGLRVYDSGSLSHQATASLLWDSLKNKWIYQQVSGSMYDGGMLISGPRNTSGIGNEAGTTNNALMKGQGGDHITSSRVFDTGTVVSIRSNTQITGSLIIHPSYAITGSLHGTGSWAQQARTASFLRPGTYQITASRATQAVTASYIAPLFISASAAFYGFGSGGGTGDITGVTAGLGLSGGGLSGDVTLTLDTSSIHFQKGVSASAAFYGFGAGGPGGITLIQGGTGINVSNGSGPTVTVSATSTGGGTNLGLVYAVSLGYLMP
jgi:hypothetical protein